MLLDKSWSALFATKKFAFDHKGLPFNYIKRFTFKTAAVNTAVLTTAVSAFSALFYIDRYFDR